MMGYMDTPMAVSGIAGLPRAARPAKSAPNATPACRCAAWHWVGHRLRRPFLASDDGQFITAMFLVFGWRPDARADGWPAGPPSVHLAARCPSRPPIAPTRSSRTLGPEFADPVRAEAFPQTILRFRNDRAAATVGLDTLTDEEWIAHFGRFEPLPGNIDPPLAQRYHGHQFRVYNPDLGDGRGFTFAQMREAGTGRLLDLGHQGLGPDALVAHRRRAADAEGRRARGAGHGHAGGAGRAHLALLLADRDRRGPGARRRAQPDALGGAGAAVAQPHPLRHLPAPRLLRARRPDHAP